jgi:hypothetical protein
VATPQSPLTVQHLEQMRNALDTLANMRAQIDLAKRAGIDVSQQEAQLVDAETRIRQIKNVYFPGS